MTGILWCNQTLQRYITRLQNYMGRKAHMPRLLMHTISHSRRMAPLVLIGARLPRRVHPTTNTMMFTQKRQLYGIIWPSCTCRRRSIAMRYTQLISRRSWHVLSSRLRTMNVWRCCPSWQIRLQAMRTEDWVVTRMPLDRIRRVIMNSKRSVVEVARVGMLALVLWRRRDFLGSWVCHYSVRTSWTMQRRS